MLAGGDRALSYVTAGILAIWVRPVVIDSLDIRLDALMRQNLIHDRAGMLLLLASALLTRVTALVADLVDRSLSTCHNRNTLLTLEASNQVRSIRCIRWHVRIISIAFIKHAAKVGEAADGAKTKVSSSVVIDATDGRAVANQVLTTTSTDLKLVIPTALWPWGFFLSSLLLTRHDLLHNWGDRRLFARYLVLNRVIIHCLHITWRLLALFRLPLKCRLGHPADFLETRLTLLGGDQRCILSSTKAWLGSHVLLSHLGLVMSTGYVHEVVPLSNYHRPVFLLICSKKLGLMLALRLALVLGWGGELGSHVDIVTIVANETDFLIVMTHHAIVYVAVGCLLVAIFYVVSRALGTTSPMGR